VGALEPRYLPAGSAPSLPETPMAESIALYSPAELLVPRDGWWKWLLGVTRTANDCSVLRAGVSVCVHMCVVFKSAHVLKPLQHASCES